MNGSTMRFLDTAIPMYAVGGPHVYQIPCHWIMQEVAAGRMQVAINTEPFKRSCIDTVLSIALPMLFEFRIPCWPLCPRFFPLACLT